MLALARERAAREPRRAVAARRAQRAQLERARGEPVRELLAELVGAPLVELDLARLAGRAAAALRAAARAAAAAALGDDFARHPLVHVVHEDERADLREGRVARARAR